MTGPLLTIAGRATDEDVAAVVAALLALTGGARAPESSPRPPTWVRAARIESLGGAPVAAPAALPAPWSAPRA